MNAPTLLMPVSISERALAEIESAAMTFELLRPGHGPAFRFAVDAIIDAIAAHPHLYQRIGRNPAIRRAVLQRFAFIVVYHIADEVVTVLAVLPSRARPRGVRSPSRS